MSIKKKRLLGILLSFVMVLGLMPGMKLMVYADDTTPNTDNTGKLVIEMDFDIDSWPPYDDSPRDIPVIITWNDNNDKDGNRPESIVVRLLVDGVEIANAELNEDNNWRTVFTGLPRLDENKKKIEYTITEDPVECYTAEINGFNIRNNYEAKSMKMILRGIGGSAGEQGTANLALDVLLNAPEGADLSGLKLFVDGPDPQLKKTLTYEDVKDGSISFGEVLPGAYMVRDTNADTLIEGYVMDAENSKVADAVYAASGASARLEFKYTWKLQEPIDYNEVEENYDPFDNIGKLSFQILGPDDRMPKTITYSQFKDGKYDELQNLMPGVYTVVERNAEGLLKYYTLTSDSITGMVVEVKAGGTATAKLFNKYVTQKPDDEFVDIPVTKTWNDNNNADGNRPFSVTVRLYADGVEVDSHVLTVAENWQYTFKEKPRYQEDYKTEIVYTVNEDPVAMYSTTINGYNIVNDYQRPEPVAITPVSTEPIYPYTIYKTEINEDSSITTTDTTYYEDGSITELVEREWVKGRKKGRKNTKETVMDPDGKVISVIMETISFSKKQTKTETKDIKLADGYSFSSTVKTYKSGKQIYKFSETLESGVKQEYAETKKPDGTLTRKVMDTNTKGKSTLTVTTKELVKTVTKYKVTGDGRIRLTSFKTEGDTVIIPKTVTFNGKKYMIVSLGKNLFKGMEGIKEIYIYAENLKKIYAGAFNGVPSDAKFYIKATTTNYKKIVRMIKKSGFGKVDYTKI